MGVIAVPPFIRPATAADTATDAAVSTWPTMALGGGGSRYSGDSRFSDEEDVSTASPPAASMPFACLRDKPVLHRSSSFDSELRCVAGTADEDS